MQRKQESQKLMRDFMPERERNLENLSPDGADDGWGRFRNCFNKTLFRGVRIRTVFLISCIVMTLAVTRSFSAFVFYEETRFLSMPRELDTSFCGISSFFNPAGFQSRVDNYRAFRTNSRNQGLFLTTVELALSRDQCSSEKLSLLELSPTHIKEQDTGFSLSASDADQLVQLKGCTYDVMWQKERLLNIAVQHLPDFCETIMWIDTELILVQDDWIGKTKEALKKVNALQPFDRFKLTTKEEAVSIKSNLNKGRTALSGMLRFTIPPVPSWRKIGFAFAYRAEAIRKYGLYDGGILDGGDRYTHHVFGVGNAQNWDGLGEEIEEKMAGLDQFQEHYLEWAVKTKDHLLSLDSSDDSEVSVKASMLHLFHGSQKNRMYGVRDAILRDANFTPFGDIALVDAEYRFFTSLPDAGPLEEPPKIWAWSSNKFEMHSKIAHFFRERKEDE